MRAFVPREINPKEPRVALLPTGVARLVKLGVAVDVEAGLGQSLRVSDDEYRGAGATVLEDTAKALAAADLVLRLRKPPDDEPAALRSGAVHISYLDPFNERALVEKLAAAGVSAICMEMIPRSTIAQKMDALSSQASVAGYAAVIIAAERIDRMLPMLMTPAGTIRPLRVFVIGVGVAGLQAIATARRLGAQVEAFDTRPVVEEEVKSLGAKFVKVDLGETDQTAQGYARQLTPEQLARQRELMVRHVAEADIVITAAQVFGRKAPIIVTHEMLNEMKPGSVIVDLAVESGGNVEGLEYDTEATIHGVQTIALANLPGRVATTASEMYSNNLVALIQHFWDGSAKSLRLDREDEILKHCLVTHGGSICSPTLLESYSRTSS